MSKKKNATKENTPFFGSKKENIKLFDPNLPDKYFDRGWLKGQLLIDDGFSTDAIPNDIKIALYAFPDLLEVYKKATHPLECYKYLLKQYNLEDPDCGEALLAIKKLEERHCDE